MCQSLDEFDKGHIFNCHYTVSGCGLSFVYPSMEVYFNGLYTDIDVSDLSLLLCEATGYAPPMPSHP